jgi:hypothetical protein
MRVLIDGTQQTVTVMGIVDVRPGLWLYALLVCAEKSGNCLLGDTSAENEFI